MIYTQGINKIHISASSKIEDAKRLADKAGYGALSFDGIIWIKHARYWFVSDFGLEDFEVK